MVGLFFSITLSVTLLAIIFLTLKGKLVKIYGAKVIYILSLLMAIRLLIPYSIQLPDVARFTIYVPKLIPILWAAGTLTSIVLQIGRYFYTKKRLISMSNPVNDAKLLRQYQDVRESLFIDRKIPLLISDMVESPMLIGIFKPFIIIPANETSDIETEMIFRHELTHYRNHDPLKKMFFSLVLSLQWFNPFVRMIMHEFCNSIECICDDAVTKNADKQYKKDYCYMLLKTGEKNCSALPSAIYFSTKEMLKMRIDSVFGTNKKRSGSLLIITSTLCLTLASSFLCSCTVETPSDVKDEMSRIEQGIENEKENGTDNEKVNTDPHPVSEVTASALSTIDEWNAKNGIFKFDDCDVLIPQVSEFAEYLVQFDAGLTPQTKYEQYKYMEKELFGENFFDENELLLDPGTWMGDGYVSLEEYLALDKPYGIICNSANKGKIENQISVVWYVLPHENDEDYLYNEHYPVKVYNCLNISDEELAEEVELDDGKITVADVIKLAEETINKYNFCADDKIKTKVKTISVYEGKQHPMMHIFAQAYYGDVPFVELNKNYDDTDRIKISGMWNNGVDMDMISCNEIGEMRSTTANMALTPTGNSYKEILSVEQILQLLKKKLSNSIVYDVESIILGNSGDHGDDASNIDDYKTYPIYNVTLNNGEERLLISIDAITGDMNIFRQRIHK